MTKQTVVVPDLGGAETVEVIELGLQPGDQVEVEDSLLVLESDKATMDVPSPASGIFTQYLVAEGATVKVGDAIAEIEVSVSVTGEQGSSADESETIEQFAVDPDSESEPRLEPKTENHNDSASPAVESSASDALKELTIQVPDIGSDDKVDVIEVCVAVGDEVNEGDTLLVLESDKATMDVPASHTGKVVKILVAEGDKLGTGDNVAVFEVISDAPSSAASTAPAAAADTEIKPAASAPAPAADAVAADPAARRSRLQGSPPSHLLLNPRHR